MIPMSCSPKSSMSLWYRLALLLCLCLCWMSLAAAQDLAPRAYVITPLHANAVTLTWSFYSGGFDFNGTVPVTGATGTYSVPVFSYYHSLSFFGRSANVTVSLPYGVGTFTGDVLGQNVSVYRSGLLDLSARFSVNLKGGPAMAPREFVKWKQKTIIGASLKIVAPTGSTIRIESSTGESIGGRSSRSLVIRDDGDTGCWMAMAGCGSTRPIRRPTAFRHLNRKRKSLSVVSRGT